jgi:hypothetical protein
MQRSKNDFIATFDKFVAAKGIAFATLKNGSFIIILINSKVILITRFVECFDWVSRLANGDLNLSNVHIKLLKNIFVFLKQSFLYRIDS